MTRKALIGIGISGLAVLVTVFLVLSSFKATHAPATKPCTESVDECCLKNGEGETGSGPDLETISGKFFSSASY